MTRKQQVLLDEMERRGFDICTPTGRKGVHVKCSQCEALVICGIACHETGCPHTPTECRECGQSYANRQDAYACCQPCEDDAEEEGY